MDDQSISLSIDVDILPDNTEIISNTIPEDSISLNLHNVDSYHRVPLRSFLHPLRPPTHSLTTTLDSTQLNDRNGVETNFDEISANLSASSTNVNNLYPERSNSTAEDEIARVQIPLLGELGHLSGIPLARRLLVSNAIRHAVDQLSLNGALTTSNLNASTNETSSSSVDPHDLYTLLSALESGSDVEECQKILSEINRIILLSTNETTLHVYIRDFNKILGKILAKNSKSNLWLGSVRIFRSIIDLYPNFIENFRNMFPRLLKILKHSEDIELIEETIGAIDTFVKSYPMRCVRRKIMSLLARLLDFVSVMCRRTIIKIYNQCLSESTSLKVKCIRDCIPALMNYFKVGNDVELIQQIIICLHKILGLILDKKEKITKVFDENCLGKLCEMYIGTSLSIHYQTLVLQILSNLSAHVPEIAMILVKNLNFIRLIANKLGSTQYEELAKPENLSEISALEMFELVTLISNFYPPIPDELYQKYYNSFLESYCSDLDHLDLGLGGRLRGNYMYIWEYYKDDKWKLYPQEISEKIEIAYQERQMFCYIHNKDVSTTFIEFDTMEYSTLVKKVLGSVRRKVVTDMNFKVTIKDDPRLKMVQLENLSTTLYVISLVSIISNSDITTSLAHKALIILIKIASHAEQKMIAEIIEVTPILRDLSRFLRSSSLSIAASACLLFRLLYTRFGIRYHQRFHTEGTYSAFFSLIENTILPGQSSNEKDFSESKSSSDDFPVLIVDKSDLNYTKKKLCALLSRVRSQMHNRLRSRLNRHISDYDANNICFLTQNHRMCEYINVHHIYSRKTLKGNIMSTVDLIFDQLRNHTSMDPYKDHCGLDSLTSKSRTLSSGKSIPECEIAELARWLIQNHEEMTPFKISQSKIMKILTNFLVKSRSSYSHIKCFIENFIVGYESCRESSPFNILVEMIHAYISDIEMLPSPCLMRQCTQSLYDPDSSLENKIVFALKCSCIVNFKRHSSCTEFIDIDVKNVDFHPLRTVADAEQYVETAIQKKLGDKNVKEDAAKKEAALRLRRLLTGNIGSSPYDDTSSRKHKGKTRRNQDSQEVELIINDVVLCSHLTMLQALITRFRTDSSKAEKTLYRGCALQHLYFGPSITIYYRKRRAKAKNPSETSVNFLRSFANTHENEFNIIKKSFHNKKQNLAINQELYMATRLLAHLHYINFNWGAIIGKTLWEPLIERKYFCNKSVSLKVSRLVNDPFMCLIAAFPQWVILFSEICPFLFDFSIRMKLFYSLVYGIEKKLADLTKQDPSIELPPHVTAHYKVQKHHLDINRAKLYEESVEILKNSRSLESSLSVTYKGESGLGQGPTAEFFSILSRCLIKRYENIWNEGGNQVECFDNLFPAPIDESHFLRYDLLYKSHFTMLGQLIGKAVLDRCQCDFHFSRLFYMYLLKNDTAPYLWAIKDTDPVLYNSLKYLLECLSSGDDASIREMDLRFTWPNKQGIEVNLCDQGSSLEVTAANTKQYVELVLDFLFKRGFSRPFSWIQQGLNLYLPKLITKSIFFPEEMNLIISGERYSSWNIDDLEENIDVKPYFTKSLPVIQNLFKLLSEFDKNNQKLFLLFTTSKARLPPGGFAKLVPPLIVIPYFSKEDSSQDGFLPSASTCHHTLKLPNYSSFEILQSKLLFAMTEGQEAFLLS